MPDTNPYPNPYARGPSATALDPEFIAAWKRDRDAMQDAKAALIEAKLDKAKLDKLGRTSTTSACAHTRWSVFDTDPWGIARCTDCGERFPLANALRKMLEDIKVYQDRLEACLGMVVARASSVPKGAPLIVQAGRAIEELPEEDEAE